MKRCGPVSRLLLVAASLLAATSATSVAEPLIVPLRLGDVGTEREFIRQLLVQARLDCPGEELTLDLFQVGRIDLNDDGQYELIVSILHFCFDGTCYHATPIYELRHGEWVEIADLGGANANIAKIAHLLTDERDKRWPPQDYVTVLDETIGGWRSLIGDLEALRWSNLGISQYGGDYDRPARPGYHSFCASDYCQNVCFADSASSHLMDLPYDNSGER